MQIRAKKIMSKILVSLSTKGKLNADNPSEEKILLLPLTEIIIIVGFYVLVLKYCSSLITTKMIIIYPVISMLCAVTSKVFESIRKENLMLIFKIVGHVQFCISYWLSKVFFSSHLGEVKVFYENFYLLMIGIPAVLYALGFIMDIFDSKNKQHTDTTHKPKRIYYKDTAGKWHWK